MAAASRPRLQLTGARRSLSNQGVNCAAPVGAGTLTTMRDVDTIDSELRLLAAVRRPIREHGGRPSSPQVDELLDERAELTKADRGVGTAKAPRSQIFRKPTACTV